MGATGPHFSDAELRCKGDDCNISRTAGCGVNGCTQELVDVLERLRQLVSGPLIVNSAYRCPRHNKEVGGQPKSEHMLGLAADVRAFGMTAAQLEKIALTIPEIHGLGRADCQKYIHIDVRNTVTLVRWCYDVDGDVIPYFHSVEGVSPLRPIDS